jgi:hypothetical protein
MYLQSKSDDKIQKFRKASDKCPTGIVHNVSLSSSKTEMNRKIIKRAGQVGNTLGERFEPTTRKIRYQAELQARRKKKSESWVDLVDDLQLLADKAYPDLEDTGLA